LLDKFGPLAAVNFAESVRVSLRGGNELLQEMEIDGLLVGRDCALLNSAKRTPTLDDLADLVDDAHWLRRMLASEGAITTKPDSAMVQRIGLRRGSRIIPLLSGNNFSAVVEAQCGAQGVGIVRPSGDGFVTVAVVTVDVPMQRRRSVIGAPACWAF